MRPISHAILSPKLMGVLNVTPDSFYDGGQFENEEEAFVHAMNMVKEGADIIDIGGESTRPPLYGTPLQRVAASVEWSRIAGVVRRLVEERQRSKNFEISVDTRHLEVARQALQLGVDIVNVVTSGLDDSWGHLLADFPHAKLVVCQMNGQPETMQNSESWIKGPIVPYLISWFDKQIELLTSHGVNRNRIIVDPGFGFGKKKPDQDLEILTNLHQLKSLNLPILAGLSRKSFMGVVLEKQAPELLSATIAMNTLALWQGASFLRVHDVSPHRDVVKLWHACTHSLHP